MTLSSQLVLSVTVFNVLLLIIDLQDLCLHDVELQRENDKYAKGNLIYR